MQNLAIGLELDFPALRDQVCQLDRIVFEVGEFLYQLGANCGRPRRGHGTNFDQRVIEIHVTDHIPGHDFLALNRLEAMATEEFLA